jgi:hypothetical protein
MPTVCFTGMDRAEEAKLKLMFSDANEWLGGDWTVVNEAQAKVIVVDLDSIYGHMTWLKVHNSGKYVIAITARSESEAEHVLLRPVSVESLVAALNQATAGHVVNRGSTTGTHPAVPASAPSPPPAARAQPVREAAPPPPQPPAPPVHAEPPSRPQATPAATAPSAPAPAQAPRRMAPAHAREPLLWDYLQPGGLAGPSRLEHPGSPPLVIDPRTDTYIGGASLKPYVPYCEMGALRPEKWHALSGADLNMHLSSAAQTQPLLRLRWLYALVHGKGELAPGYDPTNRFRLTKWPKTEREYPKHLRIATTMMQSPGTPAEIAAKSDTPLADVIDFINASIETGFAEAMNLPPAAPDPGPKTGGGGLFGRLRGGRG